MLQAGSAAFTLGFFFEGVPPDRVVVLPNVGELTLIARVGEQDYKVATYLSCPSASRTTITLSRTTSDTP